MGQGVPNLAMKIVNRHIPYRDSIHALILSF